MGCVQKHIQIAIRTTSRISPAGVILLLASSCGGYQLLQWMETERRAVVQANQDAENDWVEPVNLRSSATLFPPCNSWYLGPTYPTDKPRVFMPYIGFSDYCQQLDAIRDAGYKALSFA